MNQKEELISCKGCGGEISAKTSSKPKDGHFRFNTIQRVLLCEACKKFYCRYREKSNGEQCCCAKKADDKDTNCRPCRYNRCLTAMTEHNKAVIPPATESSEKPVEKVDFTILPCAVCGCSSSGFHFGIVSCEGCKSFFRRSMSKKFKFAYTCRREGKSEVGSSSLSNDELCPRGSSCRKCRLQRCLDSGMSLTEISIGRHTLQRRVEIDAELRKHSAEGSFLKQKLCRRSRAAKKSEMISPKASPREPAEMSNIFDQSAAFACDSLRQITANEALSVPQHLSVTPSLSLSLSDQSVSNESWEWVIEQAVHAVSHLATISTNKICFDYDTPREETIARRMNAFELYIRCISEFVNLLQGMGSLKIEDRVLLYTQSMFPVAVAQLSLNFDVESQQPNLFGIDREGPAWQIDAEHNMWHMPAVSLLCEAGNRFVGTITNLQEFALLCALLVFNPETPYLSDVEGVLRARARYETALINYSNKIGSGSEQRVANFYQLLAFFRSTTSFFHQSLADIIMRYPLWQPAWPPLFRQLVAGLVNLPLNNL